MQVLYNLQAQAAQIGDDELEGQMSAIITMLDSPVFQQLLKLQVKQNFFCWTVNSQICP